MCVCWGGAERAWADQEGNTQVATVQGGGQGHLKVFGPGVVISWKIREIK